MPKKEYHRPCPICGFPMYIVKRKKGGVHKRSKIFWACSEKKCGHRELEEGESDKYIRIGCYDEEIGLLPLTTDIDNTIDV